MKCHGALYIPLHNCINALKRAAECVTPCLMPGPTSRISIRPILPIQAWGRLTLWLASSLVLATMILTWGNCERSCARHMPDRARLTRHSKVPLLRCNQHHTTMKAVINATDHND